MRVFVLKRVKVIWQKATLLCHYCSPGISTHSVVGHGGCICDLILGKRGHMGQHRYHSKEQCFLYALHCEYCSISNHLATICDQISLTLKSTIGSFSVNVSQNLGRKGLTDVSQILTRSGRDMWLSYAKEITSLSFADLHNAQKCQTNRQITGSMVWFLGSAYLTT